MIKKLPSKVFALITLLTFSISTPSDQEDRIKVGNVEKVQYLAEAIYADTTRWIKANSDVMMMDLLKTRADSRLKVRFNDGSTVVMGENAELMVDQFVYVPDKEREIALNALKGALRFIGNKLKDYTRQDIKVKLPVGTLGVRGTDFWTGRIDGDTGVLVIDGEVLVKSKFGLVTLGAGEGTMIKDDGTLSPAKKWGEAKKNRALRMVEFQ